jgi:hypothetical protein
MKLTWCLHDIGQFSGYRHAWQSLNSAGMRTPLLDAEFISPLLTEFATGKEVLACCERNGKMQAMAILAPAHHGAWATFQPPQAPIGIWVQRPELDSSMLLSGLIRKLPGFPLILGVMQQDPCLLPRPGNESAIRTIDYVRTARISLRGAFADYWRARGKNLRHNMKKQRSRLEKSGVTARLQISTDPDDVAAAVSDFGKLETAGWKGRAGTAVHGLNAQGRYYQRMLESFCARGAGRIYRLWYNDRIAAMDLCISGHQSFIVLKTAYDEALADGTSPAFLLRQEQVEKLFGEDGLDSIEFYGRLMDWHLQWTDDVRTMYHINHYRFSFLSRMHEAVRKQQQAASEADQINIA